MRIRYVGPYPTVTIVKSGQTVDNNQIVDVPDDLAGRPPSGDPDSDSYDPGAGLLAQTGNWKKAAPTPNPSETDDNDEENS